MEQPTCETCRFYESPRSECRRHAPIYGPAWNTATNTMDYMTLWPFTIGQIDWCGDHEPKQEQQA